jgi:outer membrane protein TolC
MSRKRLLCAALLAGMGLGMPGCQSAPRPSVLPSAVTQQQSVVAPSRASGDQILPVQYAKPVLAAPAERPAKSPAPAPPAASATTGTPTQAEIVAPGHPQACDGLETDFATALAMASGQNPRVAFAQEAVSAASAQARAAGVLWLPSIQAGVSYHKHEGTLQETNGNVSDNSRNALNAGLGAGALGAGSEPVPGVFARFQVADAVFQPRVASARAAASNAAFNATLNDTLLDTSLAYVNLLRTMQQRAIAVQTLRNAQQLAEVTKDFARVGQGAQADADRAEAELVVRQNNVPRAEEAVRMASARLAELLGADPTIPVRPAEPTILAVELVSPETPPRELVATALTSRPELGESRALVAAAVEALHREQFAPLVPSILLGVSDTGFGGGQGGQVARFGERFDFDAMAVWQVRNLGLGERAAKDEAGARLRQARHRDIEVMNRVAREVVESHAQVQARREQVPRAELGVKAATDSYRRNLERIRGGQGLPLELLQAIQALDQAQSELLRATADYSEAQFRLYRALGWPGR